MSEMMKLADDDWPSIEYDGGYPVDEDFSEWGDVTSPALNFEQAGQWLLRELPAACEYMCCQCSVKKTKSLTGNPVFHISFSTMGWSGAESIIALINRRVDLNRHMLSWRRGGHYVFEVKAPPPRPISEVRKQAWATRRKKYGSSGHNGSYAR
ncbi:hypothetical protein M527_06360 [Sphingobium indicum IP26]|uniref:Uncharacterized protein n=1 Tax=Sphingobium indicum F2 TaxID=1450518 RepID=A0A8E0WTU1_9SPHN|nr:hypothetical protein [Sphingobium indicum]EPR09747.1 hypothetical protein M527_06360 [Sphingobium indicum IP26]KER37302.1 hypothetical protein AL00_06445 [Sphingobium indicum F2]